MLASRVVNIIPNTKDIIGYKITIAQVRDMFDKGVVDIVDLPIIETKLAKKYCIKAGSIYREYDLITGDLYANMSHKPEKEVISNAEKHNGY